MADLLDAVVDIHDKLHIDVLFSMSRDSASSSSITVQSEWMNEKGFFEVAWRVFWMFSPLCWTELRLYVSLSQVCVVIRVKTPPFILLHTTPCTVGDSPFRSISLETRSLPLDCYDLQRSVLDVDWFTLSLFSRSGSDEAIVSKCLERHAGTGCYQSAKVCLQKTQQWFDIFFGLLF